MIYRQWYGDKYLKIGSAGTIVIVVYGVGHGIVDWHARHSGPALLTTSLQITRKIYQLAPASQLQHTPKYRHMHS